MNGITLCQKQVDNIHIFVFRSIILSLPSIAIAFQYVNVYCGQISIISGGLNITLSQWLIWVSIIEIIKSYLLILVTINKSYQIPARLFDIISDPLKKGLFITGFIVMFTSTLTCASEASLLWIFSFINLLTIFGDIINRLNYIKN